MNNSMRAALAGAGAVAVTIASPGTAEARTAAAGATIKYHWTSDSVQNQITYYAKSGKRVTRQVRFSPLPIGFSREMYGYTLQVRLPTKQTIGSRIQSSQIYATCKVEVNRQQVSFRRALQSGAARCLI